MNAPHKLAPAVDIAARPTFFGTGVCYPALASSKAEREEAVRRLFAAAEHAQPSDGISMTRDEMHER